MSFATDSDSSQTLQSILEFYSQQQEWASTEIRLREPSPSSDDSDDSTLVDSTESATNSLKRRRKVTVAVLKKRRLSNRVTLGLSGNLFNKRWGASRPTARSHRLLIVAKHIDPPTPESRPSPPPQEPSQLHQPVAPPAMQFLLQSFKSMLDVHAESCRTLEALVRDTERVDEEDDDMCSV